MKIVYCIPHLYNAGGMERVLTQKANHLAAQPGCEVLIVTTEPTPEGMQPVYFPLDSRIRVVHLNIDFNADFQLPIHRKWGHHRRKQKQYKQLFLQLLAEEQADICVSLCGKEIEWLGSVSYPCRKLAEIHFAIDYRKQLLLQYHSGLFWSCLGDYLTRQLVRNCHRMDGLVVLTHADEKRWRQAGLRQVHTIPNPSALEPSLASRHDLHQVLAVGRLHPQKGFDLLLQAWSQLAPMHPDWMLRIVGEGDCRSSLEQQIHQLSLQDSVRMDGLSKDICADYRNSGLFVLSSRWEGLPLALIEAMSQGTCCVAFDCPQGPAELLSDGVTGRLVPSGDITALVQALHEQMSDPEGSARMGRAAYNYACEHFALEPIMNQWEKYLGLCS